MGLVATPSVDLNTIDAKGSSAYAFANGMGHVDICTFLSKHGAESTVETVASSKLVPRSAALHEAVRQGHSEACAFYIKECQAGQINAAIGGETPLLIAAGMGAGRITEMLLKAEADPNIADAHLGESALLRAVLNQASNELLWLLLESKADPSQRDLTGRTPITMANAWGNELSQAILTAAASGELIPIKN